MLKAADFYPAPIPDDEPQRLAALKRACILDTAPEPGFDALTRTAAHLCSVPIALVSLVDHDRQWFKSKVGLDAAQTPRDISFCGHAIAGDDLFEVVDPLQDERFCCNPLVTEKPKLRYYAGAPLIDASGFRLGTLCVIDTQAHAPLTPVQCEGLQTLAAAVASLVERRKLRRERALQATRLAVLEGDRSELERVLSHSLSEPLRSIVGHLQLLRRRYGEQLPPAGHEHAELAMDNSRSMRRVLDDLLTFIQLGQHTLSYERVQFSDLLRTAWAALHVERWRPEAALIPPETDFWLRVDVSQFLVLLRHLLSNAVRYVPEDRQPVTQVRCVHQGDEICIRIQDNGCGIDAHAQTHAFDLFRRGGATGGTGIGLSAARKVAQRHHGALSIDHSSSAGTVVAVRVPSESLIDDLGLAGMA